MKILRTPDERFEGLTHYPAAGMRVIAPDLVAQVIIDLIQSS